MITGAVLGVIGAQTLRAQQPAESRKVLVTQDLEGIDGYEIRIWRTHIGPGVIGKNTITPELNAITCWQGLSSWKRAENSP